jgi:hypothetical protein
MNDNNKVAVSPSRPLIGSACRDYAEENKNKIILHLCADTGSDSKPYKDAGYNVILVGKKIGVENFQPPPNIYGIIANPVCTEFSIARSGGKARLGEEGLFLVRHCQRIIEKANPKFWVIENPATGKLKDYLGDPQMVYQPFEFGSGWTKKTALWGKFNLPKPIYKKWEEVPDVPNFYIRSPHTKHNRATGKPQLYQLHKSAFDLIPEFIGLPKPKSDMEFRSICSQKFARAFFEVNR